MPADRASGLRNSDRPLVVVAARVVLCVVLNAVSTVIVTVVALNAPLWGLGAVVLGLAVAALTAHLCRRRSPISRWLRASIAAFGILAAGAVVLFFAVMQAMADQMCC